jgi:hypothetical protein
MRTMAEDCPLHNSKQSDVSCLSQLNYATSRTIWNHPGILHPYAALDKFDTNLAPTGGGEITLAVNWKGKAGPALGRC